MAGWRGTRARGVIGIGVGLYTFTKRTAPFAMTLTFDAPSGEVCVARREMSNSPLQALTLLNDPVFVEGSQALGSADGEGAGDGRRRGSAGCSDSAFAVRRNLMSYRCLFIFTILSESGSSARSLMPPRLRGRRAPEAIERAAWTVLARAILNLDETVTKG